MTRLILTDAQWARIAPHCLGKASAPGRTGGDPRMFLEAVLWIARTGSPWRDLPDVLGNGNTVFKRFRRWVKADVFRRISDALSGDPDLEFAMADGTIVKVHRHGRERKRGSRSQAIGKSRGGRTTKILALTDALGDLTRLERLPGRRCDAGGVAPPIEGIAFEGLIADKAFDAGWIIADLDARGAQGMISRRANRAAPRQIDAEIHKRRRLTENLFGKLEEFKRIALRACKTDARFVAMIHAAATTIGSR